MHGLARLRGYVELTLDIDDPEITHRIAMRLPLPGEHGTFTENRDALTHYMLQQALGYRKPNAARALIPLCSEVNRVFTWNAESIPEPMCYLMLAIRTRLGNCMRLLLERGADPLLAVGPEGTIFHTPLTYATYFAKVNQPLDKGMLKIIEQHIKHSAKDDKELAKKAKKLKARKEKPPA